MKTTLFITSHLFSGSDLLVNSLNENPRVQIWTTGSMYSHPSNLEYLHLLDHKMDNTAAIYGDHLLYDVSLTNKVFYDFCKFIYFIRPARSVISELLLTGRKLPYAIRYYCFRLRKICEMEKRTPG